jgi:hypothetical protein
LALVHGTPPWPNPALDIEAGDEVAHLGVDLLAPAAAGEDAVVAGALPRRSGTGGLGDAGAQAVRGLGLARAGDVVEFALDGQQGGGGDVLRAHQARR